MLTKSLNYNTILSNPNSYAEIKMLVDGTYYGMPVIQSLETNSNLMGEYYALGNIIVNQFQATLYLTEADIHRYSEVDLFVRFTDGEGNYTNWLPKGKFIVADANYDPEQERISVMGYDFLCKGNVIPYPQGDSSVSTWENETMRTVATRMSTLLGIALEDDTQVSQEDYPAPPYDYTIREILGDIALMGCGNWYLTYVNSGDETDPVATPLLRLWHTTDTGTTTALGRDVLSFEELPQPNGVAEIEIVYGYNADGVKLVKIVTGTGNADISYEVKTIPDGTVMQTLANKLAADYFPSTYQPFTATGCYLDAACELGDPVSCNSHTAILGKITTKWSVAMWADISAPSIFPQDDFFYNDAPARQTERIERDTATNSARITVNADAIQAEVTRATSAESDINTSIRTTLTQTADALEARITTVETDLEDHAVEQSKFIRYGVNGLELGTEGSQTKAVLTDTRLTFTDPTGDDKAYIGQDPTDNVYKFFVVNGHIVNKLELGDHWDIVASGVESDYRLTIRWRN